MRVLAATFRRAPLAVGPRLAPKGDRFGGVHPPEFGSTGRFSRLAFVVHRMTQAFSVALFLLLDLELALEPNSRHWPLANIDVSPSRRSVTLFLHTPLKSRRMGSKCLVRQTQRSLLPTTVGVPHATFQHTVVLYCLLCCYAMSSVECLLAQSRM